MPFHYLLGLLALLFFLFWFLVFQVLLFLNFPELFYVALFLKTIFSNDPLNTPLADTKSNLFQLLRYYLTISFRI